MVWLRSPHDPCETPYLCVHFSDVFGLHFFGHH
jgi:hypothetical protein